MTITKVPAASDRKRKFRYEHAGSWQLKKVEFSRLGPAMQKERLRQLGRENFDPAQLAELQEIHDKRLWL
jgi:hypothetical protein